MNILDLFKPHNILKRVNKKNKTIRIIIFIICIFLVALSYNTFFVKNEIVIGGMSGLAIVIKKICGLNTTIFIVLSTMVLLFFSLLLLGKNQTKQNLICASIFPIALVITEPIANNINIQFDSYLFTIIISILTYAIPLGIIYKIGYSTGGADIICQIICKYAKTSVGKAGNYINIVIIITTSFILGVSKTLYYIFAILLSNTIVDFIILGNSDSKFCIIKAKNTDYLEDVLKQEFNVGYSLLNSNGGIDKKKRKTIMCVVTSREYYRFINLILDIDRTAFVVTHDCYEVIGGTKKRIINS